MRKRFLLYPLLLLTLTLFASAASVETSNWDYSDTEHAFSCDLNLSGADMDGQIFAALFAESGQMKSVTSYPAAETVHLAVPGTDTTDYLRVLWMDSRRKPIAKQTVLRMRDNGKTAYEDFEESLRKSQHDNWAQSGDPTRLLVSSSEALPWAEYGVKKVIPGGNNFYVLEFLNPTDTKACKAALEKLPCVRYVVYDAVIKVDVDNPGAALLDGTANTPPLSWGVAETGIGEYAANLKERGLDKKEIIVAVVDSGVDSGHEFLQGRVLAGYDFADEDETPQDEQGHGTHVAGIIADCTPGMNVKILPVRVLTEWGSSTPLIVYRGIEYAVAHGANVINLSLGLSGKNPVIEDAIQDAISKNVTVVVAACNKNADAAEYCPANIGKCITVAALQKVTDKLNRWELSNYGKMVDIAAPGGQVYSCIPKNRYDKYDGTSMAAPHVSAAAALLMCERGTGQTARQIETTLQSAADALPEDTQDDAWKFYKRDNPGVTWADFLGAGFLNMRPFIGFYALLYSDGEFVFQKGNTPNPDKPLLATYPVAVADGGAQYAPWYESRLAIRTVTFADTFQPRSTALWFYGCNNLTEIRGLDRLDTSKVTDMSQMFARCAALTTLDLTALDTSGVTNTRQMFQNCTALETLDLTGWNTANVTNMADMFNGCTALKTVFVSDGFKTDKVSNSIGMFNGCTALPNYDPAHTDKAYARIHGGTSAPGYFADKNAPTTIVISGQHTIEIPADGQEPSTVTLRATVLDQFGSTMPTQMVTWTITDKPDNTGATVQGITIDSNGVVSVTNEVKSLVATSNYADFKNMYVHATSGSASAEAFQLIIGRSIPVLSKVQLDGMDSPDNNGQKYTIEYADGQIRIITATALDQYGTLFRNASWDIFSYTDKIGVSIDASGVITISSGVVSGEYIVTATYGEQSSSAPFLIKKTSTASTSISRVIIEPSTVIVSNNSMAISKATAYDGENNSIKVGIFWSVYPANSGVSIAADGQIAISSNALNRTYVITATPDSIIGTVSGNAQSADLTVENVSSNTEELDHVALTKSYVTVNGTASETSSARAFDKNNKDVSGVTWTITPSNGGVTIDNSGTINIFKSATAGNYTIHATKNGITRQTTLSVINNSDKTPPLVTNIQNTLAMDSGDDLTCSGSVALTLDSNLYYYNGGVMKTIDLGPHYTTLRSENYTPLVAYGTSSPAGEIAVSTGQVAYVNRATSVINLTVKNAASGAAITFPAAICDEYGNMHTVPLKVSLRIVQLTTQVDVDNDGNPVYGFISSPLIELTPEWDGTSFETR